VKVDGGENFGGFERAYDARILRDPDTLWKSNLAFCGIAKLRYRDDRVFGMSAGEGVNVDLVTFSLDASTGKKQ
jgi:hypothetical protein